MIVFFCGNYCWLLLYQLLPPCLVDGFKSIRIETERTQHDDECQWGPGCRGTKSCRTTTPEQPLSRKTLTLMLTTSSSLTGIPGFTFTLQVALIIGRLWPHAKLTNPSLEQQSCSCGSTITIPATISFSLVSTRH